MASIHSPRNWAQVIHALELGHYFRASTLKIQSETLWVLSDPRATLYGWRDEFANTIIDKSEIRKQRYLDGGARKEIGDITYVVARKGNALVYVEVGGIIRVNPKAMVAERYYRDAAIKIQNALQKLAVEKPNHWLFNTDD